MLVVLAVVGLAATLLLPQVRPHGFRLEEAAGRLADAIAFGRERAILGRAPMRLVLDLDAGRWQLGRPGAEPHALAVDDAAPAALAGRPSTVPTGLTVRSVGVGGAPPIPSGVVALDLHPEGDPVPVRIELADAHGHAVSVVVPPAAARPAVIVHRTR